MSSKKNNHIPIDIVDSNIVRYSNIYVLLISLFVIGDGTKEQDKLNANHRKEHAGELK